MSDGDDDSGWGGIAEEYEENRGGTSETNSTNETSETSASNGTSETRRQEEDGTVETNVTTDTHETSETSTTTETGETGETTDMREEWNGRTLYLPDDLVDEVDLKWAELELEATRQNEDLGKGRDFYPAVFRAALRETSIEEEIGLE